MYIFHPQRSKSTELLVEARDSTSPGCDFRYRDPAASESRNHKRHYFRPRTFQDQFTGRCWWVKKRATRRLVAIGGSDQLIQTDLRPTHHAAHQRWLRQPATSPFPAADRPRWLSFLHRGLMAYSPSASRAPAIAATAFFTLFARGPAQGLDIHSMLARLGRRCRSGTSFPLFALVRVSTQRTPAFAAGDARTDRSVYRFQARPLVRLAVAAARLAWSAATFWRGAGRASAP